MKRLKRTMPLSVGLLLMIIAGAAVSFTVAQAMNEYAFIKPYVGNIVFQDPNMQLTDLSLDYDAASMKYTSAGVTVKNFGSASASASIYVYLYDVTQATVASGQGSVSGVGSGSSVTVAISLTWTTGKNATHVTSGQVTVQE